MNRLLQQARQTNQRRMTYFYLSPTEDDYLSARMLARQMSLNLSHAKTVRSEEPYDDELDADE
ncbi:hypothetical protein H0484_04235 [Pusillimonas sp. CC-YST705]|uniref:Uncharacterized protein n=1 Tax=Mesopusillimonas faecipullorum TaxID=2755040 RepID=A0ABS8CA97_9BURK|nr:hypothetical protein [Mesopusillimonas faecipullorum]MCB5362961.1 hypothetical protein [Mesopusillimonas faecipullorum]